ncbi:hypothetical protein [Bacillus sp. SYJ]|uniref:hypothetical protein n=1 Tax=Bacillus sp. SYJ TaxID=2529386 RepID=UPI001036C4EB|nr:hypothetical protein [Bacillus sp. SYJ]
MQKLHYNCNESINLGHTDIITLERVRDWYGKGKYIQLRKKRDYQPDNPVFYEVEYPIHAHLYL